MVSVIDLAAAVDAAGYVARLEQAASGTTSGTSSQVAEARSERDEAGARHVAALRRRVIVSALPDDPVAAGPRTDDDRARAAGDLHRSVLPARLRHARPVLGWLAVLRRRLGGRFDTARPT